MKNGRTVEWRGYSADYTEAELRVMGKVFKTHPDEAAVIHEAKARFGGLLRDASGYKGGSN